MVKQRKTHLQKQMALLEHHRATMNELRKSMILVPTPKKWWKKEVVEYAFSFPNIRSRLERLMGSSIVRITDRQYMQKLQERITEEYLDEQKKRIKEREMAETVREKQLILGGKMALENAPEELLGHPVVRVSQISQSIVSLRRSKMSSLTRKSSVSAILDDVEDDASVEDFSIEATAVSGLTPQLLKPRMSIMPTISERNRSFDLSDEKFLDQARQEMSTGDEDLDQGFQFKQSDYDKLKFEAEEIKLLKEAETVDEMYRLADEIIGPLRNYKPVPQSVKP